MITTDGEIDQEYLDRLREDQKAMRADIERQMYQAAFRAAMEEELRNPKPAVQIPSHSNSMLYRPREFGGPDPVKPVPIDNSWTLAINEDGSLTIPKECLIAIDKMPFDQINVKVEQVDRSYYEDDYIVDEYTVSQLILE